MNVEWTDHVKSPGVIVERRQKYYITAVTLAALITRLCIAGSNAPSWQNRTRNWRTCDSWLNEIGVVWWRWTLIVTTSAGVWRQRWLCFVWSRQQSDESVTCDRTACLATTWTSWPSCPCTATAEIRAREGWPSARPTGRVIRVVRSRLHEWRQFVVPSSSRSGRQPTVLDQNTLLDHVLNFIIYFVFNYYW